MLVLWRSHAEPVVFTDKNDRQFPYGGEIQRLMEHTLVRRAISEERHGDLLRAAEFSGECGTRRERNPSTDNTVGTQNPRLFIGDVH